MQTKVLLSTVTTLPRLEPAFELAASLGYAGVELMPYRWTTATDVQLLVHKHRIPVLGVHLPFWWETKSILEVFSSEVDSREWIFACLWALLFGPGHMRHPAIRLLEGYLHSSYCLIHPDVFWQSGGTHGELYRFLCGRQTLLENERPKLGENADTHDPKRIKAELLPYFRQGGLMFDPGHLMIAQVSAGLHMSLHLSIHEWYEELRPAGLHLSFSGQGRLHDLPTEEEWNPLAAAIRLHPPRYLVVETRLGFGAAERIQAARAMIWRDLVI